MSVPDNLIGGVQNISTRHKPFGNKDNNVPKKNVMRKKKEGEKWTEKERRTSRRVLIL